MFSGLRSRRFVRALVIFLLNYFPIFFRYFLFILYFFLFLLPLYFLIFFYITPVSIIFSFFINFPRSFF